MYAADAPHSASTAAKRERRTGTTNNMKAECRLTPIRRAKLSLMSMSECVYVCVWWSTGVHHCVLHDTVTYGGIGQLSKPSGNRPVRTVTGQSDFEFKWRTDTCHMICGM